MEQTNQDIIKAIAGVGAQAPDTTLSTGLASSQMPSNANNSNIMGSGLPQPGPGLNTPNAMNTQQGFFTPQPYNPLQQMYQPMIRHGIGKDQWSSGMGLDQQAILNNLGLGGQQ